MSKHYKLSKTEKLAISLAVGFSLLLALAFILAMIELFGTVFKLIINGGL